MPEPSLNRPARLLPAAHGAIELVGPVPSRLACPGTRAAACRARREAFSSRASLAPMRSRSPGSSIAAGVRHRRRGCPWPAGLRPDGNRSPALRQCPDASGQRIWRLFHRAAESSLRGAGACSCRTSPICRPPCRRGWRGLPGTGRCVSEGPRCRRPCGSLPAHRRRSTMKFATIASGRTSTAAWRLRASTCRPFRDRAEDVPALAARLLDDLAAAQARRHGPGLHRGRPRAASGAQLAWQPRRAPRGRGACRRRVRRSASSRSSSCSPRSARPHVDGILALGQSPRRPRAVRARLHRRRPPASRLANGRRCSHARHSAPQPVQKSPPAGDPGRRGRTTR